jgi:site-specific DNA-adenine methylase
MNYGIPYMGSKADIIKSLALNFPKAENFYDLFGGGLCVTDYMLREKVHWYKNFHYNEIKSDVVGLVKRAVNGEFNYNKFKPEWVSREDFHARKDTDAYVRLIWSFGNNQKNYLFGEDIEAYKKSLHMAVVFDEFDETAIKTLKISKWPNGISKIKDRRLYVRQRIKFDNPSLRPTELQRLQQLQQLERLQQLQRLQQLERLERLSFSSLSYEQVEIKPNSVVYCDIPYKGTAEYIGLFDHKAFFDWAASREFPVFISEYLIEDNRFQLVYEVNKKTKLSPKGTTSHHSEKLYWNGVTVQ